MLGLSELEQRVTKEQLQSWLAPTADSSFAVAVLEDLFIDDADVRAWLNRGRIEFRGQSAAALLRAGRADEVDALLVRQWNAANQLVTRRPSHVRRSRIA
jgi:hypothetical protein